MVVFMSMEMIEFGFINVRDIIVHESGLVPLFCCSFVPSVCECFEFSF